MKLAPTQIAVFLTVLFLIMSLSACDLVPINNESPQPEPVATESQSNQRDDINQPEARNALAESRNVKGRVFFRQPTNNAAVPQQFEVIVGAEDFILEKADGKPKLGAGHMHILVDTEFIPFGRVMPKDMRHIHYVDGQLYGQLELQPGSHRLRLQFGDSAHQALDGSQYRDEIVVRVMKSVPEKSLKFITPLDNAVVPPRFEVSVAAAGLLLIPDGKNLDGTLRTHILIDTDFVQEGQIIPEDSNHVLLLAGQTSADIHLQQGEHLLRVQASDDKFIALNGPEHQDEIRITVEKGASRRQVRIVEPVDGATVNTTFMVKTTAAGLLVEPAGSFIRDSGGHMHILVNTDFIALGDIVPRDDRHIHFTDGGLTKEISLSPGTYTLKLQMADGVHVAFDGPEYRDEITINVVEQ